MDGVRPVGPPDAATSPEATAPRRLIPVLRGTLDVARESAIERPSFKKIRKKIEFTAIYKKKKKTPVLPLKQNPKLTGFGGESGGTPTPKDRS